jgi:hypothetical protein
MFNTGALIILAMLSLVELIAWKTLILIELKYCEKKVFKEK